MSDESYDVVIVGAGSGGVSLARDLVQSGRRVALVASTYVGGECPYVACMPSKSLLRSARARHEADQARAHGGAARRLELDDPARAWTQAVQRRDEVANQRDDTAHADELTGLGIAVVRGFGRLAGHGTVQVGDRTLRAADIVLDTGSVPVRPDIPGLDDVPVWTSDEALSRDDRPARLIVLGAGPIGCELAQAYAAFGVEVTVIDAAPRPLPNEDEPFGEAMQQVLTAGGVTLVLGATPERAEPKPDGLVLRLDDGRAVAGDRLLLVVGRRPATDGLGLDTIGVEPGEHGEIEVDARCRVTDGVWAIGDVTGLAPYTHTANHQAGVVRDELLGGPGHDVTPDALPRAVFTEPPFAATGLTTEQADGRRIDVVSVDVDLADVSRAGAEGEGPLGPDDASGGLLRLLADRNTARLVGAAAIGPEADAWITEATLAIRAGVPIGVLADVVRAFPTFAEAYTLGYQQLAAELGRPIGKPAS